MAKKGLFEEWEDELIRQQWQTTTDSDIAAQIGRTAKAVARRRKILGYSKKNGRPGAHTQKKNIIENPTEYNLSKLSKEDRLKFYKTQFDKNPRYNFIINTLLADEIEYYKHKYIEIIDSLDSISLQEEDLLHNMIMKEIHIMRLQREIKEQTQARRDAPEDDKPPINLSLYQNLENAEKQYVNYQEKLKMTRQQRLKTDKEHKTTITSLVREFLDMETKHKAGNLAGKMAYYKKTCKDDMSKMNFLLGDSD